MKRTTSAPICPYVFSRETKFQEYRLRYLKESVQAELTNYSMMITKNNSLVVFDLSFSDIARLEMIFEAMRQSLEHTSGTQTKWLFKPIMKETGVAFFNFSSSYGVFDATGKPVKASTQCFIGNVLLKIRGVSINKEGIATPMIHVIQILMVKSKGGLDNSRVCRMSLPGYWEQDDEAAAAAANTTDDEDED
jgi:hypothetical protein